MSRDARSTFLYVVDGEIIDEAEDRGCTAFNRSGGMDARLFVEVDHSMFWNVFAVVEMEGIGDNEKRRLIKTFGTKREAKQAIKDFRQLDKGYRTLVIERRNKFIGARRSKCEEIRFTAQRRRDLEKMKIDNAVRAALEAHGITVPDDDAHEESSDEAPAVCGCVPAGEQFGEGVSP